MARGDQQSAARALGSVEVVSQPAPSMRYARVLSSLDRSLVVRYPRLWGVTALMRIFCVDSTVLLDESETVWRTLAPDTTPLERYYVFVFRILLMSYLGLFDQALAEVAKFSQTVAFADPPEDDVGRASALSARLVACATRQFRFGGARPQRRATADRSHARRGVGHLSCARRRYRARAR